LQSAEYISSTIISQYVHLEKIHSLE